MLDTRFWEGSPTAAVAHLCPRSPIPGAGSRSRILEGKKSTSKDPGESGGEKRGPHSRIIPHPAPHTSLSTGQTRDTFPQSVINRSLVGAQTPLENQEVLSR